MYIPPMRRHALSAFLACGFLVIALAACNDNPSGVGLGVGPEGFKGGTPVNVDLQPSTFETVSIDDVTGNSVRILTGSVDDPLLGTIATTGYIDVSPPAALPDDFEGSTVQSAQLVLTPDGEFTNAQGGSTSIPPYVYGDTVSTMTVGIYAMPNEWDARIADEMLSAGGLIAESAPFAPGDTVRVDLPESWNDFSTLSDTAGFDDRFHGFQIRASSGNAAIGFARPSTFLQVVADDDTVAYDASRSFTSIERSNAPSLSDRVLLQDGFGRALSFEFTFPDSLRDTPISRAVLRLPTDTTIFDAEQRPPNFVRPRTSDLVIQGFTRDSTVVLASPAGLSRRGSLVFEAPSQSGASIRQIFQAIALGEPSAQRYQVSLSQSNNTINPLLFYAPSTGENAPRVSLTITEPDR